MVMKYDLTQPHMTVEKAYSQQKESGAYSDIAEQYRDPGTRYAFAILEGDVLAGEDLKLQSFRHLQDLTRQDADDFPYHYDLSKCHEVLNFAKLCPDVDSGVPLPLLVWQQALMCWSQGWRNADDERRFHRVIFSVARTNGKTYLTNILLGYQYVVGSAGRYNQDMAYIGPVTQQSKKGWRYIKTTFNRLATLPDFSRLFQSNQVKIGEDVVKSRRNQNQLLRLSDESGQFDSFHLSFAVHDEAGDDGRIGLIKENNGKVTSGQVQTPDHQFWLISTAYPNSTSSLYSDEKMVRNAMLHDNDRKLDDYLMVNYCQDNSDELDHPETWGKSNPILEVAGKQMLNSLISERDTKRENGSISEFINKNLNLWLQSKEDKYLNLHDIEAAVVKEPPIEIKGKDVYLGLDMSKLADDTAFAYVIPYQLNGDVHYYVGQHSWIPTNHTHGSIELKEKQDGINYRAAEKAGFATIAKNRFGYIDEESVTASIVDYVEDNELNVRFFIFDRFNTSQVIPILQNTTDWLLMPQKQTAMALDKPTVEFRRAMQEGRVHYLNDPIIQYSLKNAVLTGSEAGIKVDKDRATAKIDCVDAIIDAFVRAIYAFADFDPDADDTKKKSPFEGWNDKQKHDYFMNYSF